MSAGQPFRVGPAIVAVGALWGGAACGWPAIAPPPCAASPPPPPVGLGRGARLAQGSVVEGAEPALSEPRFSVHRTEHFLVFSDADEGVLAAFQSQIECVYDAVYAYGRRLGLPLLDPDGHLTVIYFNRHGDFCSFARREGSDCTNLNGYYSTKTNQAVFYNIADDPALAGLGRRILELERSIASDDQAVRADLDELSRLRRHRDVEVERINRLTTRHEVAHQVLYHAGVHTLGARNPGWLVEGLACVFESDVGEASDGSGSVNALRLQDLKRVLGDRAPPDSERPGAGLSDALLERKLLPLADLVGDARLFARRDQPHLAAYYAQAWSLVYYLQRRHPDSLADYVRRVSGRRVGEEISAQREIADFESAFGPLDASLQSRWVEFVSGLPL